MRFVSICDCKYTIKSTTSSNLSLATGNLLSEGIRLDNLKFKCLTLHYVKIIVSHLIYVQNMAILQISPKLTLSSFSTLNSSSSLFTKNLSDFQIFSSGSALMFVNHFGVVLLRYVLLKFCLMLRWGSFSCINGEI